MEIEIAAHTYLSWEEIVKVALEKSKNLDEFIKFSKEIYHYGIHEQVELLELFHEYEREFMNNLNNSNFVLDEHNVHCLLFVPNLYLVSLKNDYEKTIRIPYKSLMVVNDYVTSQHLFNNGNLLQSYINVFKTNNYDFNNYLPDKTKVCYPDFSSCARYIGGFLVDNNKARTKGESIFTNLSYQEQNVIYLRLYKGKPFSSYPQHIIESLPFLMDVYKGDKQKVNLVQKILKSNTYSLEDESKLLTIMGINIGLKEYFESFCVKNKQMLVPDMSFDERVLFTLYIKRLAYDIGIETCKVNMFAHDERTQRQRLGSMTHETIDIFCNRKYNTIKQVLTTACHELNHFKQFENMRLLKYEDDVDIDVYTKDYFLTITLGQEYYQKNYNSLNLEINAAIMGEIMAKEILKENDEELASYKRLLLRKNKYSLESIFGSDYRSLMEMARISIDKKRYNLNTLFLQELQRAKDNDYSVGVNSNFEMALKRFPLIEYEYDVNNYNIKRRTITQLITLMDEAVSERDKGVYKYLIHQRFNPKKNSKMEIKQNVSELNRLSKILGDGTLKSFIELLLEEVNDKKNVKRKFI